MLRIVSFNIWNVWRLTRRAWNRDDLAAEVLLELAPDLFCLQEYDAPFRQEHPGLADLTEGYRELEPSGVAPEENWNPIFYAAARFRPAAGGHHVYTAGTEYPYREKYRSHFRTLTWGVLEDLKTGRLLGVINTHYDTDAANHKSESDELLEVCDRLEREYGCPILVTGDYNCPVRGIAVQNMLAHGFRDTHDMAEHLEGAAYGCHPYPIPDEKKGIFDRYDDRFYHEDYADAIDHILLRGNARVAEYRTVIHEKTLLISDHSPVLAVMEEPTPRKSAEKGDLLK